MKWISHAPGTERKYSDDCAKIIHPNLGVTLHRSRSDPGTLPPRVMRLKRMWDMALSIKYGGGLLLACCTLDDVPCICCNGATTDGSGFTCSLCLLSAHVECIQQFALEESFLELLQVMKRSSQFALPDLLDPTACANSPICGLCKMWLVPPE